MLKSLWKLKDRSKAMMLNFYWLYGGKKENLLEAPIDTLKERTWDIKDFPSDLARDDNNFKHQLLWRLIIEANKCPACNTVGNIYEGPRGGMAVNLRCNNCQQVYWASIYPFGAYVITHDTNKA